MTAVSISYVKPNSAELAAWQSVIREVPAVAATAQSTGPWTESPCGIAPSSAVLPTRLESVVLMQAHGNTSSRPQIKINRLQARIDSSPYRRVETTPNDAVGHGEYVAEALRLTCRAGFARDLRWDRRYFSMSRLARHCTRCMERPSQSIVTDSLQIVTNLAERGCSPPIGGNRNQLWGQRGYVRAAREPPYWPIHPQQALAVARFYATRDDHRLRP
jgi:hypothetical protein